MSRPAQGKPGRHRSWRGNFDALERREMLTGTPASPLVVTSTADTGAGSLRQAILDADAQPGTSPVAIRFDIPTTDPGYSPGLGSWTIAAQSQLPAITRPFVTIDGTSQPAAGPRPGLGRSGTVGVDALPLPTIAAPSIQLVDAQGYGAIRVGLGIQAGSDAILGLSISGFGSVANSTSDANILIQAAAPGTLIEGDVLGALADGSAPTTAQPAAGDDVEAVTSAPGTIADCLIADSQGKGIELGYGSDGWTVSGDQVEDDGINSFNLDGIDIEDGSGGETLAGNLFQANWANGIDSYQGSGGNTVVDNTIQGNGIGTYTTEEDAGIRAYGDGWLIKSNVIDNNYGPGVLVTSGSLDDTITRNSFSGNGTITNLAGAGPTGQVGIDVLAPTDNVSQGTAPYVLPNSPSSTRDGLDGPANFPVFASTRIVDGQLVVSGYARPGATIELYLANPASSGFGQGSTYLGTFVQGSPADQGSGTGSYSLTIDGINYGSDTTDLFQFSIPTPADVAPGAYLTATATEAGSTSDFGPQSAVVGVAGPLTYRPTGPGPDAIALRQDSTDVSIVDNGQVVAFEPLALATSIDLQGHPGGTDSLSISASVGFAEALTIADFASTSIQVTGDLTGQIGATTATTIQSASIGGSIDAGGSIVAGSFVPAPGQQAPAVTIQGDLGGTVQAVEDPVVPGSGVLASIRIAGNILATGQVFAGSIGTLTVGSSLGGTVKAQGAGTIGDVTVGGNLTGTVSAPEDPNPGSGMIGDVSVTGTMSGTVSSGDITSVTVDGDVAGTIIAQGAGTIGDVTVGGSVTGTGQIDAPEDPNPGSGTIGDVSVTGTMSGTVSSGDISSVQVDGNVAGTIIAQGAGTIGDVTVGGSVTATGQIDAPEDPNPGSGTIGDVSVTGTMSGTVSSGDISSVQVGGNVAGTIIAQGAGTIGDVTVGGSVTSTGQVDAPEDSNPGSGTIGDVSVTGTMSGTVSSGDITSVTVDGNVAGTIIAQGAGTIGDVTVGGSVTSTGQIDAPEDPNPGSGMIGDVSVTGTMSGTVSSGDISSVQVDGNVAGTIIAQGAGHIQTIVIKGGVSGSIDAAPDSNSTSGEIDSLTIDGVVSGVVQAVNQLGFGSVGSVGSTGSLELGNISQGLTVTTNTGTITGGVVASFTGQSLLGGSVTFQTITTASIATLSGSFSVTTVTSTGSVSVGTITTTGDFVATNSAGALTIGNVQGQVNLGNVGAISYASLAAGCQIDAASIASLAIAKDIAGTVDVTGAIGTLSLPGGSIDPGALVEAGSLASATISGNMAGQLVVSGNLGTLAVGGSTPGSISAGHVTGSISAKAATGPVVLQVTENNLRRQVQAATPANPYPLPSQVATPSPSGVTFAYLYESGGSLANPQLSVQVANASPVTDEFDLSLATFNDSAKFNLARLDAVGVSGIRNVDVEGDILTAVTPTASAFFAGDKDPAGVYLPSDKLASVGVRDLIPYGGYIKAASIQAISAGAFGTGATSSIVGSSANQSNAQNVLASTTKIVQASDTFRVPFADLTSYQAGFFMDDTTGGAFDWSSVDFKVEGVVAANAGGTANVTTASNAARGADVALIAVVKLSGTGANSQIQGINIRGDGGSFSTQQYINGPITSTGPLGDLSLQNSQAIGNITAPSIFGAISTNAVIAGTITTTGLRTDPITGLVTAVPADFGRVYLNSSNQLTMTTLTVNGGAMTGKIVDRGNLLTTVTTNGGFSGQIDAQGNIGAAYTINGKTTRLGGVTINGSDSGQIVAFGSAIGDITINGGLGAGSTIAAGQGLLGNTTINGGINAGASVVSGGPIGSPTYGTKLTVNGNTSGLIVAKGALTLTANPINPANTFGAVLGTANEAAVDAIFSASTFDLVPANLDLLGLNQTLTDLANLHIGKNKALTVVPGA